jgi:hypothetical protein
VVDVEEVVVGEKTSITIMLISMVVGEAGEAAAEVAVALNVAVAVFQNHAAVEIVVVEAEEAAFLNHVVVESVAVAVGVVVVEVVPRAVKTLPLLLQSRSYSQEKSFWALNSLCGGILIHKETCRVLSQHRIWNLGTLKAIWPTLHCGCAVPKGRWHPLIYLLQSSLSLLVR